MRILLLAQVYPPSRGGTGRWMSELYSRLPGCDVVVGTGGRSGNPRGNGRVALANVPLDFASWGLTSPKAAVQHAASLIKASRLVSRQRAEQVHCAKALPEGLLGVALSVLHRVPFVCYAHGEELTLAGTSRELRALTHLVLRRASRVVANSNFTRQLLVTDWHVPEDRLVVMHPGVDTTRFAPAAPDAAVRAALGWGSRPVVLTVGALQKRKGQDTLIRALRAIRAAIPDVLYVMAGSGPDREDLENLARSEGVEDSVQFRGNASEDDLLACYQQCDLFALPNRQIGWDVEGFGMVLVEAQACGKPVVAGASGGTLDTFMPGVTGELANTENPQALAETVIALLGDAERLRTMGRHARERAVRSFDWAPLTTQAMNVFTAARAVSQQPALGAV
ncbi:MAG: glycosyltransferase family 4 protein [Acidobacteria bacterium]|nr:glycosyltransferase family 4 protein [Acidobacteriota bacterium]